MFSFFIALFGALMLLTGLVFLSFVISNDSRTLDLSSAELRWKNICGWSFLSLLGAILQVVAWDTANSLVVRYCVLVFGTIALLGGIVSILGAVSKTKVSTR